MMYHVRLLKGLRHPYMNANSLVKAEQITGFWWKMVLLAVLTLILSAVTAYFGIGNEILSKQINNLTNTEFEAAKIFFALGQILWAMFAALFVITVPSILFWTVSDIEWKKYIVVQQYVLGIFLLEKLITAILTITMGLPEISNPFSLGVIGQLFTTNNIVLQFLAEITLFKIWAIVLQYKYVKILSHKTPQMTALIVIGLNVIILIAAVFLNIMQLEKLL
ncbi:hypothetical protein [Bacillus benzoevorans]|uniref:Yip1 domain-containing protein n=1 Tax=Bacillus benzoevorans TaxID=1456 RepID=A0A7X0HVN1_9BACI|nr:hypothetical protein [Bacillus benzoevorans]MBB6447616.1 hypothetical protein [Bacillus benzoevorans]